MQALGDEGLAAAPEHGELLLDVAALLVVSQTQLAYDESTENWKIGPIDWDEFWRVVRGNGPCNRERLAARRAAHAEGEWVRLAAAAYAAKQARTVSAFEAA